MPSAGYSLTLPDITNIRYAPSTGKISRFHLQYKRWVSTQNTPNNKGYLRINIGRRLYMEHLVGFFIVMGRLPRVGMEIDHINGIKTDNRWCNLREVDRHENCTNRVEHRSGRIPGPAFIKDRNAWRSSLQHLGEMFRMGNYRTEIQAKIVYDCAWRMVYLGKVNELREACKNLKLSRSEKRYVEFSKIFKRHDAGESAKGIKKIF